MKVASSLYFIPKFPDWAWDCVILCCPIGDCPLEQGFHPYLNNYLENNRDRPLFISTCDHISRASIPGNNIIKTSEFITPTPVIMTVNDSFTIRDARPEDIPQVNSILTYYALSTIVTFATAAALDNEMQTKYNVIKSDEAGCLPYLVAIKSSSPGSGLNDPGDIVVGYAYLYPYRLERLAYRHTAELSIYLHPEFRDQGLGSALMNKLLEQTKKTLIKEIIAVMSLNVDERDGGYWLKDWYAKWNFREAGMLKQVGWKFEKW